MRRLRSLKTLAALAIVPVCLVVCAASAIAQNGHSTAVPPKGSQFKKKRQVVSLADTLPESNIDRADSSLIPETTIRTRQVVELIKLPEAGAEPKPLPSARQEFQRFEGKRSDSTSTRRITVRLDNTPSADLSSTPNLARNEFDGESASQSKFSPTLAAKRKDSTQESPIVGSQQWAEQAIPLELFDSAGQGKSAEGAKAEGVAKAEGSQQTTAVEGIQQPQRSRSQPPDKPSATQPLGSRPPQASSLESSNQTNGSLFVETLQDRHNLQTNARQQELAIPSHQQPDAAGMRETISQQTPQQEARKSATGSENNALNQAKERNRYLPDQAIPDWIVQQGNQPITPNLGQSESREEPSTGYHGSGTVNLHGNRDESIKPSQSSQVSNGDSVLSSEKNSEGSNHGADAHWPALTVGDHYPAHFDALARKTNYCESDFSPQGGPQGSTFDPLAASLVYRGKFAVPVQRPLIELWRPLYTSGIYPPALNWFGVTNPMKPHFMVYGDARTAFGVSRNAVGKSTIWGNVVNLDMDLQLTSTERVHAFVAPLNRGTKATGLSFEDGVEIIDGTNFDFLTLFFEGDLGAIAGGATNRFPPFDLPFTFGLIPLVYQNGIWANDNVLGAALALPARHSRLLRWSNFDATLFWATDNVTTDAFPGQDSAADFFGTAWFIDAYEGYIEADYAFVNDNTGSGRGYHNIALAFSRRYFARVSNSVRFIVNTGQEDLPEADRTADGHLLLIENSLISAYPNTVVPYINLFYGQGRPQSLARLAQAGGILNNTGINFETDGITNYPTLDPTGHNTFGLAAGINLMGSQFSHQLILEAAILQATGPAAFRNAEGDQYGIGMRYQKPLSHNLIFRTDHMVGFREAATNLNGSRFELRWKF